MYSIAERYIELINPTSPEKIINVGEVLRLKKESQVIDFGSGYGEVLALWASSFGIKGVGIDIREDCCKKAREKLARLGLSDDIKIIHADGAKYKPMRKDYDAAVCIGASFIWGDFEKTVKALKALVRPGGRIAIGEPYWRTSKVPRPLLKQLPMICTEKQLLKTIRDEGLEMEFVWTSSQDEWDTYVANNWRGLIAWLKENPDNPDRKDIYSKLRKEQDEYFEYHREHLGWAIYAMTTL